ncbi:MAG: lamin tail domain-containing protein [Planctomycetes bacterium]|jgi:hypothetical protein|nr:lamin tail domain-containing protein [Planctomycetota bacterium]MCL4729583.1 lamin tail domain-containing protein [Planctomycetota bacterium]
MRRVALFAALGGLMAVLSACGDYANTTKGTVTMPNSNGPNPQNLPNPNTVPKPVTPYGYAVSASPVTIEEVLIDPAGPNAGFQYVELFNASAFVADIGGWVLTNGADSYTFPYGFRVNSGARVLVHIGAAGTNDDANQFAPSFGELDVDTGSLALLRHGSDVVDFVQWGNAGNALENAAVLVGEWVAGDYVLRAQEGRSIHYTGLANDSSAWFEDTISPGQ